MEQKKKYEIDWSFYRELPLLEVYETVFQLSEDNGTLVKKGSYWWAACQAAGHQDKSPSVQIKNNRCTCYACRQLNYGTALDVVMTAFQLSPLEAAKLLDKYFPGGLKVLSEEEKKEELELPKYPNSFYKELGLHTSPFHPIYLRGNQNRPELKKEECQKFYLEVEEAAWLVFDKIHETENQIRAEYKHILEAYPSLSKQGAEEIRKDALSRIQSYEEKAEEFRKLAMEASEKASLEKMEDWIEEKEETANWIDCEEK